MRYLPRNIKIAFTDAGLTHYGGILFFNEFTRVLQLRRFLTRHLRYPRRNHDYQLSEMILSLAYPIVLGLDRIETASLLRSDATFQYLTGLQSFPDCAYRKLDVSQHQQLAWIAVTTLQGTTKFRMCRVTST